jgi:hypothetical protein
MIGGILASPLSQGSWKLNITAALFTSNGTLVKNSASSNLFTITVSPAILTVQVPVAVAATVDGKQQPLGPIQLPLQRGTHTISVPTTAQMNSTTRLSFNGWADGFVGPNRTVTIQTTSTYKAVYVTQYLLEISGQPSSASSQDWYDAGSIATISVPQTEPMPGILGLLGGKQGFQGWYENNQLLSNSPSSVIIMNKPHTLTVVWTADYTLPIVIAGLVLVALGLAYFVISRKRPKANPRIAGAEPDLDETRRPGARKKARRRGSREGS